MALHSTTTQARVTESILLGRDPKNHPGRSGTAFTSWLVQEVWSLLRIHVVRIFVYHPQTDLVGRKI